VRRNPCLLQLLIDLVPLILVFFHAESRRLPVELFGEMLALDVERVGQPGGAPPTTPVGRAGISN
jgi:hypothetical protein